MWGSNILVFPFILFPDGMNRPLYRRITGEDMAKWRQAYKTELHVVVGRGRVEVTALSELAAECKTTAPRIILVTEQQGYTVLGWEQYQKLLDEIAGLVAANPQPSKAVEAAEHRGIAFGIPVDPHQGTEALPKSAPQD